MMVANRARSLLISLAVGAAGGILNGAVNKAIIYLLWNISYKEAPIFIALASILDASGIAGLYVYSKGRTRLTFKQGILPSFIALCSSLIICFLFICLVDGIILSLSDYLGVITALGISALLLALPLSWIYSKLSKRQVKKTSEVLDDPDL